MENMHTDVGVQRVNRLGNNKKSERNSNAAAKTDLKKL